MNPTEAIDTDKVLHCHRCYALIGRGEAKVVIGALIKGQQRFYSFHQSCWKYARPLSLVWKRSK